jgi:hypothetical protein
LIRAGEATRRCFGGVTVHRFVVAAGGAAAMPMTAGAPIGLVVGGALRALLLVDQRLPIGDRNLIIVRMDFRECQEAMAVAAVIDECRLKGRLNARYLRQIDVATKLFTLRGLEVEFLDAIAAQYDHPGLLGMGRVDEHFVRHGIISRWAACRPLRAVSATGNGRQPNCR